MQTLTNKAVAVLTVVLALLIASCETAPDRSPLEEKDNLALITKAKQLEASAPDQAAAIYASLADKVVPPYKQEMQYATANAFFKAENSDQARTVLASIDRKSAYNSTLLLIDTLKAKIRFKEENYSEALEIINDYSVEEIPADLLVEFTQLKAALFEKTGDFLQAAQNLIAIDDQIEAPEEQAQNSIRIWQLLNQVPFEKINALMPPPPDRSGAWIELVYFVNFYRTQPQALTKEIDAWKVRYPTHPAAGPLVNSLIEMLLEELEPPEQIALLLPLSGRLKAPATAIRDGFIAAYLDHFQIDRPRIRVYDVGDSAALIISKYKQAIQEGADFVVGPLDKASLETLSQSNEVSTPILGLNYLPDYYETPSTLFQFGLLPEDEAAESARYAFQAGARKALVLVPDNDWGQRNANAFTTAFTELGGDVLEENAFDAQANDFSAPIKSLLNLNDSYNRYRQVAAITSTNYEFEPRRRQDVDVVFIAASPKQARLIRPQLKFHRASDIPVFATSRLFSGVINPKKDSDLNGIHFVDIPWLLSDRNNILLNDLEEHWPKRIQRHIRLFALGQDAYRLITQLPSLRHSPDFSFQGATGLLSMDQGRIHRQLELGFFRQGQPNSDNR